MGEEASEKPNLERSGTFSRFVVGRVNVVGAHIGNWRGDNIIIALYQNCT